MARRRSFAKLVTYYLNTPYSCITLLVLAAFLVYSHAFTKYFWTDDFLWMAMVKFQGTTNYLRNVLDFTHAFPGTSHFYRPVYGLFFLLMYYAFDMNPLGYHVTSFFLHAFNSILVFYLISLITQKKHLGLLCALLFTVHPAPWEARSWIAGIGGLLTTALYLMSLLSFVHYLDKRKIKVYFACLLCFILALFSKESAITLLGLLFFYEFFIFRQSNGGPPKSLPKYIPFVLIAFFYLAIQYTVGQRSYLIKEGSYRLGTHFVPNLLNYIGTLLIPMDMYESDRIRLIRNVLVTVFVLSTGYLLVRGKERVNGAKFFVVWLYLTLLPFWFFAWENVSRYTYIPAIGFSSLLGMFIAASHERIKANSLRLLRIGTVLAVMFIIAWYLAWSIAYDKAFQARTSELQSRISELQSLHPYLVEQSKLYFLRCTNKWTVLPWIWAVRLQYNDPDLQIECFDDVEDLKISGDQSTIHIFECREGHLDEVTDRAYLADKPFLSDMHVIFGNQVELLGYDLSKLETGAQGTKFHIVYFWKCLEKMDKDYTIFVHVTDAEGKKIMAQQDHDPVHGLYLTSQWKEGEMIKESYDLWVPVDVRAGVYTLRIGLWLPADKTRLKVTSSSYPVDYDRVTIGHIEIP